MAFAQRLRVIDEDVASLHLVLVLRQSWTSGEEGEISLVGCERLKKCDPVLMEQDQDGIGDFGGQSLVAVHMLDAMEDCRVGKVFVFVNEGLTNLIVRLIIQIFGGKCGGIDARKVRMVLADPVALNQLHREPPMPREFCGCLWCAPWSSASGTPARDQAGHLRKVASSLVSQEPKSQGLFASPQTSSCRAEQKRKAHTQPEMSSADQVWQHLLETVLAPHRAC